MNELGTQAQYIDPIQDTKSGSFAPNFRYDTLLS